MKFGKQIQRNQVPEWARFYLAYKKLKKVIKKIEMGNKVDSKLDGIEAFKKELEVEMNRIDEFYQLKLSEYSKRLDNINLKYKEQVINQHTILPSVIPVSIKHNQEDKGSKLNFEPHIEIAQLIHNQKSLLSALLAIKFQILQLIQFREMNSKGVVKILKKVDKRFHTSISAQYFIEKDKTYHFFNMESIQNLYHQVNQVSDHIQKDLQKTLSFLDPNSNEYSTYGAIIIEKHKTLIQILLKDDPIQLQTFLDTISQDKHHFKVIEILFEHICYYNSIKCCNFLIEKYPWLLEVVDLDQRNIFHKLALFGVYNLKDPKESTLVNQILNSDSISNSKIQSMLNYSFYNFPMKFNNNDNVSSLDSDAIFEVLINYIKQNQPQLLIKSMQMDVFGRRPLHYAVINNYPKLYSSMVQVINEINELQLSEWWYDLDGNSPLFYTILKGYTNLLETILRRFPKCLNITLTSSEHAIHNPLGLATTLNHPEIVKVLIQYGANLFMVDSNGQSALHLAARNNHFECVKVLLEGAKGDAITLINLKDHDNLTALMLAAIQGNVDICKLFIQYRVDLTIEDKMNWRAYEYAIFNGYIELAKLLELKEDKMNLEWLKQIETINKSKRDRLKNQSAIVFTLGNNDIRTNIDPVTLFESSELFTQLQNLKLVISAVNDKQPLASIDLPVRDEEPIVLYSEPHKMPTLTFDILPKYSNNELLARGSWQVNTFNKKNISIALLCAKTMLVIGNVNFECSVVLPFMHPCLSPLMSEPNFNNNNNGLNKSTRLIGHRGLGANQKVDGKANLQVGENTVLSFITAANLGAEYIEFDVQLTKDKVPVIYHDWTVTESGYDLPINAFTLEQFLNIYEKVYKLKDRKNETRFNWTKPKAIEDNKIDSNLRQKYSLPYLGGRNRSKSMDFTTSNSLSNNKKTIKMEPTLQEEPINDNVLVRVKGNNPDTIQAPFTTLAETFKLVPEHIGFNIEVKYPMVDEAEEYSIQNSEIEMNGFIDSILTVVYNHAIKQNNRPIMFSSFHPEVCLLLNLKQHHFPVFFLSDVGYSNMADPRCNSLKLATQFAKAHQLDGVVVLCDPLLYAPRLITHVKQLGLKCFTYGKKNNQLENVLLQKAIYVDAVIVDSVAAVSRSLNQEK